MEEKKDIKVVDITTCSMETLKALLWDTFSAMEHHRVNFDKLMAEFKKRNAENENK